MYEDYLQIKEIAIIINLLEGNYLKGFALKTVMKSRILRDFDGKIRNMLPTVCYQNDWVVTYYVPDNLSQGESYLSQTLRSTLEVKTDGVRILATINNLIM